MADDLTDKSGSDSEPVTQRECGASYEFVADPNEFDGQVALYEPVPGGLTADHFPRNSYDGPSRRAGRPTGPALYRRLGALLRDMRWEGNAHIIAYCKQGNPSTIFSKLRLRDLVAATE